MSQPPNNPTMDINQLSYIYQILQNQESALIEQLNLLDTQIQGVITSLRSMQGLKEADKDHEIIVSLGSNAYTYAKIIDPKKILISIGKDIVIEKTIDSAVVSMEQLQKKYENLREKLNVNYREVRSKMDEIQPILDQALRRR
ncbi:MAG: prefoldin subunit alpha [Promethearchaeota archaeon]